MGQAQFQRHEPHFLGHKVEETRVFECHSGHGVGCKSSKDGFYLDAIAGVEPRNQGNEGSQD